MPRGRGGTLAYGSCGTTGLRAPSAGWTAAPASLSRHGLRPLKGLLLAQVALQATNDAGVALVTERTAGPLHNSPLQQNRPPAAGLSGRHGPRKRSELRIQAAEPVPDPCEDPAIASIRLLYAGPQRRRGARTDGGAKSSIERR